MTQEEKQLLIRDLCARLSYGVKVNIERDFPNNSKIVERVAKDGEIIVDGMLAYDIYYYKPYLRPLSSMTKEERFDYVANTKEIGCIAELPIQPRAKSIDWLNAHHFDYRGLIEKGLALEAPEGMYRN